MDTHHDELTKRETDVLELIAEGYSDREIAERLTLSINTVKTHVKAILSKLHARRRTHAVAIAYGLGWLSTFDGGDNQPPPHNIPYALTSFVGRADALESLLTMLTEDEPRLITLTGPPGTGKTRLALEAARHFVTEDVGTFPDGVFFADLTPLTEAERVPPTVARVLFAEEAKQRLPLEGLAEELEQQHALLVLDNFEQVLAAAPLLSELLRLTRHLRVLVTSRIPLDLYAEHTFPVRPLDLPEPSTAPAYPTLLDYGAVELFDARVKQRDPAFSPGAGDVPAIAELCHRLDGLPLAIELAAGQVGRQSLVILPTLTAHLDALRTPHRDVPERHQSLEGAIAWSVALLAPETRRVFAQVSAFAGGWSLAMAERVCQTEGAIATALDELEDHNLITVDATGRYQMLVSIQDYAREQLRTTADHEATRDRHADAFTALARQAYEDWFGEGQAAALARLRREEGNLDVALGWLLEEAAPTPERITLAARLVEAMYMYWQNEGHDNAFSRWFSLLKPHAEAILPGIYGHLLTYRGQRLVVASEYAQAEAIYGEALDLLATLEDPLLLGGLYLNLGSMHGRQGHFPEAEGWFLDVITLSQHSDHPKVIANRAAAYNNLTNVAKYQGDYEQALAYSKEALALSRQQNNRTRIASVLHNTGRLAMTMGRTDEALDYLQQALHLCHTINNAEGLCTAFYALADLVHKRGDVAESAVLLGIGGGLAERIGYTLSTKGLDSVTAYRQEVTARLGAAEFERLYEQGAALPLEEAVAYGLAYASTENTGGASGSV